MSSIFWGFLLTFLDFNLTAGTSIIGLLPDFIGFLLIAKGLNALGTKSEFFTKALPLAKGMFVYTAILYALDLFGFAGTLGIFGMILGMISTIVGLYISYNIVQGILDLERLYSVDLNGQTLFNLWKPLAVFEILVYATIFVPLLGVFLLIAILITTILFLINLNTTKNRYEQLQDR